MHLTRRYFLQSTGALSAYLGVAPVGLLIPNSTASTVRVNKGKALVVIFLRGGADGLNLVVPHGDPAYEALRRSTRIAAPETAGRENSVIDLDGFFGLHPRLRPLAEHFESGHAIAAQAVGYDQNTRSHFEEQDVWETGIIGNTVNSDGWLNRHLATSAGHGPIRALAIGDTLPRILRGDVPSYAVRGIEDLALPDVPGIDPNAVVAALEHAYCTPRPDEKHGARDLLAQTAGTTLEGMKKLTGVIDQAYKPAAPYPSTDLARRLMQVARLIKADVGLEVAEIDFNGWDTHQNQGGVFGPFGNLAGTLAGAMDAFVRDLGDRLDDVVVVTLTDFGRTAAENGTNGTDHGWANCMFLLGGPVAAANRVAADAGAPRKVLSAWPGLAPDQLHEGRDLLHTTDFRDVLGELVRVHLGNPNLQSVLPDHEFTPVGLIA